MTAQAQTSVSNIQGTEASVTAVGRVLRAIGLMKGVDDAALKDIEQIVSVVDDHVEPSRMPTTTEVDTGPAQSMRGGQAPTQVAAHSNLMPQQGIAEMYEKFDSRMSAMQKAMSADIGKLAVALKSMTDNLAAVVKAANEEKDDLDKTYEEKDSSEKMTKAKTEARATLKAAIDAALRKARVALRKAEDDMEEDEDEKKEMMEKAKEALAALKAAITKAEDDMEDDEDEKMAEKAHGDLRGLTTQLRKAVDAHAKKAAKASATTTTTVIAPSITKDDVEAAMTEWAASKGIPVADVFAKFGRPAASIVEPPTFAKAISDDKVVTMEMIDKRIETADEAGMKDTDLNTATELRMRLGAVRKGLFDSEAFASQVRQAPPAVQAIFALPRAA